MDHFSLAAAVVAGIALLLWLVLYLKIPAFLALLLSSIAVGLLAGQDASAITAAIQNGMGSTLGFVATVVGLGAIFGAILEHSGGARAIAAYLVAKLGVERAPAAMMLAGFVIAIPVFFDVAFIILTPVLYALQRQTGLSLLRYALPLLAGLAVSHAFIPPTPGPVAVAEALGVDLGWVMLAGVLTGLPAAVVSGLWYGRRISGRIFVAAPEEEQEEAMALPPAGLILGLIGLPIVLIVGNTLIKSGMLPFSLSEEVLYGVQLVSHPFTALIIANLLAWYVLGVRRGMSKEALLDMANRSMGPAGAILLLTGAGGVFKEMLMTTGAGKALAESLAELGFPALLFAFLAAALIRLMQGSATVAMITAAGLVAPLLEPGQHSSFDLACLVTAIASGSSILSHVNDSGFWLVSKYLYLSEREAFRSWSVLTTILAVCGFAMSALLSWLW